eukprot:TRINITY_DN27181_c0_g1_i1.p1 TRINITY_DN27181_c0_g1~~TRINITY_DN27181_c0_g1_i1.p1  ORF type:complete len:539 (+),score=56.60 TRINITY_DN27181_c0_g1_i1:120-1736(+)
MPLKRCCYGVVLARVFTSCACAEHQKLIEQTPGLTDSLSIFSEQGFWIALLAFLLAQGLLLGIILGGVHFCLQHRLGLDTGMGVTKKDSYTAVGVTESNVGSTTASKEPLAQSSSAPEGSYDVDGSPAMQGTNSFFTSMYRSAVGTTSLEDQLSQLAAPSTTTEEVLQAADTQFLHYLHKEITYLGCGNFLLMPLILFGASRDPSCMKYLLAAVVLKGVVMSFFQRRSYKALEAWVSDKPSGLEALQAPLLGCLPIPAWVRFAACAFIEYIDPDLDGANAGQSWNVKTNTESTFDATWQHVPLIGTVVTKLGLSGILTLLVILATLFQIIEFKSKLDAALASIAKWPLSHDASSRASFERIGVWMELQHACDASSVSFLAEAFHALARHEQARKIAACETENRGSGYTHCGRSSLFRTKVLGEALPSLWFSISLLGLASGADSKRSQLALMCVSIVTSIVSIIGVSFNELIGCVETVRVGWLFFGYAGSVRMGAFFRFSILLLNTEVLLACIARLTGVFYCESHILNLTEGCYGPPSQ